MEVRLLHERGGGHQPHPALRGVPEAAGGKGHGKHGGSGQLLQRGDEDQE